MQKVPLSKIGNLGSLWQSYGRRFRGFIVSMSDFRIQLMKTSLLFDIVVGFWSTWIRVYFQSIAVSLHFPHLLNWITSFLTLKDLALFTGSILWLEFQMLTLSIEGYHFWRVTWTRKWCSDGWCWLVGWSVGRPVGWLVAGCCCWWWTSWGDTPKVLVMDYHPPRKKDVDLGGKSAQEQHELDVHQGWAWREQNIRRLLGGIPTPHQQGALLSLLMMMQV